MASEVLSVVAACDLCGSSAARLIPWAITGRRIRVAVCQRCGCLYNQHRFDESEALRLYGGEIRESIGKVQPADLERTEQLEAKFVEVRARARREVMPLVRRHFDPHGKRVIELRPTRGGVLAELQAQGAEVEGVEIFPLAAQWLSGRLGRPVHVARSVYDFWTPAQGSFDAVSMLSVDVIPHVPSPTRLLEGAFRRLVPGGLLFLCEQDPRYVERAPQRFNLRYPTTLAHLHHPTPGALRAYVRKVGFELLEQATLVRDPGGRRWEAVVARRPYQATPPPSGPFIADDPRAVERRVRRAYRRHVMLGNPLLLARHQRALARAT